MASRLDEIEGPSWAEWLARGVRAPGKAGAEGVKAAYGGYQDLLSRIAGSMAGYNRGEGYDPGPMLEAAMMGPGASIPALLKGGLAGAKVDLSTLPALYLKKKPQPAYAYTNAHDYHIVNEEGKRMGYLQASTDKKGNVHIEQVGTMKESPLSGLPAEVNPASHALGTKEMMSLFMGLSKEFPEAKNLTGFRISGARRAAGSVYKQQDPTGSFNVSRPMPQFSPARMEAYLAKAPSDEAILQASMRSGEIGTLSPAGQAEVARERLRLRAERDTQRLTQDYQRRFPPTSQTGPDPWSREVTGFRSRRYQSAADLETEQALDRIMQALRGE